jgi:hypothetical protein
MNEQMPTLISKHLDDEQVQLAEEANNQQKTKCVNVRLSRKSHNKL